MLPSGIESFRTMQREVVIIESETMQGRNSSMNKTRPITHYHYTTLFRSFTTWNF